MKKLLLILLIPLFIFGAVAISRVTARNDVDYNINLGNNLSNFTYDGNSYVEITNKAIEDYSYMTIPDNFDLMAEDAKLELYLEPETLAIAVRVKENGYVYSSYSLTENLDGLSSAVKNPMKSGVSLDLFINGTPVSISFMDTLNTSTESDVQVASAIIQPQPNGFIVKVDFDHPSIDIKFELHVGLDDGNLVVNVPNDTIIEYNPNLWNNADNVSYYLLQNIVLYQFFGSTISEADGYVLIPDGSGALISLESSPAVKTTMTLEVYGEDNGYMSPAFRSRAITIKETKRLTMPLFGMIHDAGNTGFYTIIEDGTPYAQYNFKSTGIINNYYTSYFNFRYRQSYQQYQSRSNEDQYRITFQDDPNEYDVSLRYVFLSGSDADYVGMAKSYQKYLLDTGGLTTSKRDDYESVPTKIDFIASDITQGILSKTRTDITTYQEMIDILSTLQNDGYSELITTIKTFDMSEMGYRFDIYNKLGGRSDFKKLISFLDTNDIQFSYYLDYARSYKDYSKKHAQTLSKREIFHIEFSSMYLAHLVNDTEYYIEYAHDDYDNFEKYGIDNVALAGLDRSLYTSWDSGVKFATQNMSEITEMLEYYETKSISAGVYTPDAYMYRYTDEYYDAPISSSDYSFISASVPFLQLVLGGYMDMYSSSLNFASDEQITLLRLVEYGVFPSYILTGGSTYDLKQTNSSNIYISEYDVMESRMDSYRDFFNEGLETTIQNEMTDHTFLAEGVVLVAYEDGTQIVLNYNSDAVTVDEVVIEPLSYVVIS